ncbi:ABC transporter permease [Dermatophilus congolensis]|uniref:ABC transporter permease n=1 Tax=Dermatophilus congolensis TaxID=1863 RepID=UPI001AAF868F|nr:ABC transporter permease subunit [Dermatophilus congolensis]MBO3130183.1 ABC transporter permease subunit [Dermatophilus congolensis]MBO3131190.1 ABC transporter permease subunit [Dermatophilus congolensis]MBO3134654.1 ABC transporter permease subunit [Dermatophilus congolensis]MBO3136891.1 ABC transporter permease subunit [Dermatophilus congolensis]MBO3139135.1 ABC transporter permease subunit [Dermatophilus congolensis]
MNRTIIRLAAASIVGQKRIWALVAFPLVLFAIAGIIRLVGSGDTSLSLLSNIAYPLMLPLVALLAANSTIGPEVEDGSVVYLLSKPVNRYVVVVSKFFVAWIVTMIVGVLPLPLAAITLSLDFKDIAVGWAVAGVLAGTAYTVLFVAASAYTRHAVSAGVLYVLMWEGTLGGFLQGVSWVSIRKWGERVGSHFDGAITEPNISMAYAIGAAIVVVVVGLWFAGDRLRSLTLKGE